MSKTQEDKMPKPVARISWDSGERSIPEQRRLLIATTVVIIATVLAALTAFVWREHELAIEKSVERAVHLGHDLARDLEQTLLVARTVISQVDAKRQNGSAEPSQTLELPKPESFSALLASLHLPFELHALEGHGTPVTTLAELHHPAAGREDDSLKSSNHLSADRWTLDAETLSTRGDVVPLVWKPVARTPNIEGYAVDLSLAALNAWLERERTEPDDQISLFWMNDDGTATLLARAPMMAAEPGQRVQTPWIDQARQSASGTVIQESALEGRQPQVAFQRLDGAASNMVVVLGTGTQVALAAWRRNLRYLVGLALFLVAAMSYGSWRLDRSLRELTRSQQTFQLILDSGQVWDWNISNDTMRYAPSFLTQLGADPAQPANLTQAFYDHVVPEDLGKLKVALKAHLQSRVPYHVTFRVRDKEGNLRWMESRGQAFWDENGRAQYMAGTTLDISDRVALEEDRRQALQHLDTVANASPVLFWTSDLKGQVHWVNRRWLDFTGLTEQDALGQGWMQAIEPEDRHARQAQLQQTVKHQTASVVEYRLRHADGSYHWMLEHCLPYLDADKTLIGFIGSCVDITDLRRAENEAHQRGAMLEGVFGVLQDLLFVINKDGRFVHYQGAADGPLYVPPEVFLGKTVREVLPSSVATQVLDNLAKAGGGQLQEFAYSLDLPEGRQHFEARMARLPGTDHFMVVARDITEREELRSQRERLQKFMGLQAQLATNFINLPVQELDHGIEQALAEVGAFSQADRACVFEYDLLNQNTSNTHEWCAPGIAPMIENLQKIPFDIHPEWFAAHQRQETIFIPEVSELPPGTLRDILIPQGIRSLISLPMMSQGQCIGFVGFDSVRSSKAYDSEHMQLLQLFAQMLVNVHERRTADAKLRQMTAELEQRVAERTAQLDVSVVRLSQANRELESFAYSVSHDLKAPLRSVEGFASLLLDDGQLVLPNEARDYLQRIQRATHHMARLINDLLAYCRMEELDRQIEPLPLMQVVNDVVNGMLNEIDLSNASIRMEIPPHLNTLASSQGLAMVLRNLIDNALKFTPADSKPDIAISARQIGTKVQLSIKDQGLGFDMRYHDRIFAIFQRLHRPDQIAGTGIGLAMVHKAVQRMNGRIWAESQPGKGAEFFIELPMA